MNISSEIFPSAGSNFSDHFFFNDTGVEISFEMVVQIISIVLGIPTNSYVIWLIVTGAGNGLSAEFFSLNISVCEILLNLISVFSFFSYLLVLSDVAFFGQGLGITGRPLFQCLMCVERYLAVVHPVTFLRSKPLRYRVICSVAVWTVILALCGVNMLAMFYSLFDFLFCFLLAQFILFFSIQLFCCVAVLRALKQSGPGERGREREDENHMKKRAFNVILIFTVTTVITHAPGIIFWFILLISVTVSDYGIVASISHACILLGSLVQPFLFIHRVGKLPFQLH